MFISTHAYNLNYCIYLFPYFFISKISTDKGRSSYNCINVKRNANTKND